MSFTESHHETMISSRFLRASLLGMAGMAWALFPDVVAAQRLARTESALQLSLFGAQTAAARISPDLVAAREGVAAAAARERQSGAYPNPTLAYDREQTSGGGQTYSQSIATLDQPIELGVRGARREAARIRREAAEARRDAVDAQLRYDVARAYALTLAADRRATLADQAAEAFGQALRVSERRLAAGDVSGYANRRIRLEAARYAIVRAEAALARRSARLALASLVLSEPTSASGLILSDSLPLETPDVTADTLVALALRARAELRASERDAQAGAAEASLARRERLPVPVLSGGVKTERVSASPQPLRGFAAGVSLPLPLWNRSGGAIDAAAAESRRRIAETESMRRRVTREVLDAADAYRATAEQITLLAPQLGPESSTALRAAQVAYSEGEASLVEWLDAVRAYHEAESSFATLRAELLIRRAALERAVGTRLSPLDIGAGTYAPARKD